MKSIHRCLAILVPFLSLARAGAQDLNYTRTALTPVSFASFDKDYLGDGHHFSPERLSPMDLSMDLDRFKHTLQTNMGNCSFFSCIAMDLIEALLPDGMSRADVLDFLQPTNVTPSAKERTILNLLSINLGNVRLPSFSSRCGVQHNITRPIDREGKSGTLCGHCGNFLWHESIRHIYIPSSDPGLSVEERVARARKQQMDFFATMPACATCGKEFEWGAFRDNTALRMYEDAYWYELG